MKLNEIISMFCTEFGVEGVQPDEGGAYALAIDDMELSFAESGGALITASDLGELPAEGRERFYRMMLTAMHGADAADGAVFSIDADRDVVVLHRRDELDALTFEAFKAGLEKFVNSVEEWRGIFQGLAPLVDALDKENVRRAEETSHMGLNTDGFIQV